MTISTAQPGPAVAIAALLDEPLAFRDALASMVTSVCVVTTTVDDTHHGFTANSVTSVSMEPPLVLVCLADTAECHDAFCATDAVAVNVLAHDQAHLSRLFATRGADKFGAASFGTGRHGSPVLDGATVVLEGAVHQRYAAGDHTMILVEVTGVARGENEPLTYQGRRFRGLAPSEED